MLLHASALVSEYAQGENMQSDRVAQILGDNLRSMLTLTALQRLKMKRASEENATATTTASHACHLLRCHGRICVQLYSAESHHHNTIWQGQRQFAGHDHNTMWQAVNFLCALASSHCAAQPAKDLVCICICRG